MKLNVPSLLVELIFGLVAVSSFVVWAMICSRVRRRQPLLPYRPRQSRSANVFAVWLAAVWIANHFFVAIMSEPGQPSLQGVQSDCALKLMLMCLLLIMLTRLGQQPLFEFGLHLTALRQQAADGLLGFLASLLPVFLVLVLTLGFRSEETQHPLLRLLDQNHGPSALLWIFLAVVVLAPLTEELLYRVVLQGWLQTKIRPPWAICVVAAVFSAVHGFPDSLPLFPLAIVLGYIFYQRHSFLSVVITHGLFNAIMLSIKLLEMWSAPQTAGLRPGY